VDQGQGAGVFDQGVQGIVAASQGGLGFGQQRARVEGGEGFVAVRAVRNHTGVAASQNEQAVEEIHIEARQIDRDHEHPRVARGGEHGDEAGQRTGVGDRIVHTPLALEVLSMDGYRVALVRVTRLRQPQPDEDGEPDADENEESPTE